MKIAQIIPGSGGSFYCGNCLRDSKYLQALRELGHEVIKVPLYLPIFDDAHDLNEVPVFYGAVNLYLKQQFPLFRHVPAFVGKMLDSKPLLHIAAQKAGSTRAKGLEKMTLSMLLGEEGNQKEELEKLVAWLRDEARPDVVHLSNALLLGLAHRIKQELPVPVVCSLQDEDVWVDVMDEPFRTEVWQLMGKRGREVDAFVAVSDFYAGEIRKKMTVRDDRLHTIHLGVDPGDYRPKDIRQKEPVIGFLSRMCQSNGLHMLVDAFLLLKKEARFSEVKLKITGGKTGDDLKFIKEQKQKVAAAGFNQQVDWQDDFDGEGRQDFFDTVSVVTVPVLQGEAFGLYQTEALASGIPIVQPALGAFPEIAQTSGGGFTYTPNTPEKLAEALGKIILDKEKLAELSRNGQEGVKKHFNIKIQAEKLVNLYQKIQ